MSSRKAILVTYRDDRIVEETCGLAEAADFEVLYVMKTKKLGIGKYGLGKGKAEELKDLVEKFEASYVIVDERLRTSQNYNLSRLTGKEIIDREKLILDIFARRAASPEAKLQVKLAQLMYELPRAREMVRRLKMGEQPGLHGYGRYEVEKYVWSINKQIHTLREKLRRVSLRRELQRRRRRRLNIPFIALAGYTGAGKTTLFNKLAKEFGEIGDKPFTTLSTTVRKFRYKDVDFFVSDTVGFIDRLPHYLIEAFKSTLEELNYADLVLLLTDSSVPKDEFERRIKANLSVLSELAVDPSKVIVVLNKVDLIDFKEVREREKIVPVEMERIAISARTGFGLNQLKERVYRRIVEGAEWTVVIEEEEAERLKRVAEWMKPLVKVVEKPAGSGMLLLAFKGPEWLIDELKIAVKETGV